MTKTLTKVLLGLVLLVSMVLGNSSQAVIAQTESNNWDTPINLSHSGLTMDPIAAVDINGGIHVIWQDASQGKFLYTQTTADGWSQPTQIAVPFPAQPTAGHPVRSPVTLVALSNNRLGALWLERGELRYSVAIFDKTKLFDNWVSPVVISTDASAFAITTDATNAVHMVFIQSASTPGFDPGIYYTKLTGNVSSWLTPKLLYASPYYRNGPTQSNDSVDIATSKANDVTQVYVSFDNRNRKRVFFTHSADGGIHWGDAQEMDGPATEGGQPSPFNVRVHADEHGVMLVWQVSQSTNVCFQNYRFSSDEGANWSESQRMRMTNLSCAEQIQFLKGLAVGPVLMTLLQNEIFFTAWNGKQWSDAQVQSILSGFTDPETLESVIYGSRQILTEGKDRILAVGSDKGSGGDTWLTGRPMTDLSSWFTGSTTWRVPTSIQTVNGTLSGVDLAADVNGQLHAIWSQFEEVQFANGETTKQLGDRVLYYSTVSDGRWSSPAVVLRSPKTANNTVSMAEGPAMVIDSNNQILVVWRDSSANELLFSWANAAKAVNALDWSKPVSINNVTAITGALDLWVDGSGLITLAYSVPINEQRGIYITQSSNKGVSWTDPVRVFDGAAAGWNVVGSPRFAQSTDKMMHLLWAQEDYSNGANPGGLYYAQSIDAGKTWGKPETVSTNVVLWSEILPTGNAGLVRAWQEKNNGQSVLLYQVSNDEGKTWSQVERVTNTFDLANSVSMASDRAGHVHLNDLIEDEQKTLVLRDLFWDGTSWTPEEMLDIGTNAPNFTIQIDSAISSSDQLAVIGLRPIMENASTQVMTDIYFTSRQVNVSSGQTPEITVTNISPTLAITPTLTNQAPQPTPTIDLASLTKGGPVNSSGTTSGLLIGALLAMVVVIGGMVLRFVLTHFANRS